MITHSECLCNSANCAKVRIVQLDAGPEWHADPLLPAAHSSTLLWLFAVPYRMSAMLPLPCSLLSTLYSLLSALQAPLSALQAPLSALQAPLSALHAPVPTAVRHGATERRSGERRRMSLVSGDMLCRQQNDGLCSKVTKQVFFTLQVAILLLLNKYREDINNAPPIIFNFKICENTLA